MTEAEAHAALRAFEAVGELEPWIAEQRWEAIPDGWRVRERLQGWHFRLEPMAGWRPRRHVRAWGRAGDVVRAGEVIIPGALDVDPCPGAGGDRGDPLWHAHQRGP